MKKILAVLLATSSVAVFADTFQDFNNNLYAQYTYASTTYTADVASANVNGYGIGGTAQSKNNFWMNASANDYKAARNAQGSTTVFQGRAGYALEIFGDNDSGMQVIPFVNLAATGRDAYAYGIGVQPEYRMLDALKLSMAIGLNGQRIDNQTSSFAFTVNPEVQYDIAKTIMVSAGYGFNTFFNGDNSQTTNDVTVKVGYLF